MAIYVRKATLLDHLTTVFLTPLVLMLGSLYVKRLRLFVVLVGITLAWWFTNDPKHPVVEAKTLTMGLFFIGLGIVVIMPIAVLMTTIDHFRFRGWTDEGKPRLPAEGLDEILNALIASDPDRMRNCFSDYYKPNKNEFESQFTQWRRDLGEHIDLVTSEQLGTVDHVLFRAALPGIFRMNLQSDKSIALVPMINSLQQPVGTPMKVALVVLSSDTLEPQIAGFDLLTVQRPEILS